MQSYGTKYFARSPTYHKPHSWPLRWGQLVKIWLLLWIIYVISVFFLLCFHVGLFIDTLWSPVGKRLTSWLSFVKSNCEVVTFPLIFWVRCGAWLYRFLIFALFLTFFRTWLCCISNYRESRMQQHGIKYFACAPPTPHHEEWVNG